MNTQVRQKTSFVPASKSLAAPKSRRPSLSRAESEDRLIKAAIELLHTHNAAEISVRQVAQVADVNHGLIHSYFGSKANLFAQVGSKLLEIVMQQITSRSTVTSTPLSIEAKMFVNIGIWMLTTGESPKKTGVDGALLKVVMENFVTHDGVAPESAETLAFIAISMICAGQLVPMLGVPIGDVNFESVHQTWRHMVKLLADNPIQSAT
ncbi:MAG: TetR/AcrR family transcriptional regulator [Actinomycetota bacterium]